MYNYLYLFELFFFHEVCFVTTKVATFYFSGRQCPPSAPDLPRWERSPSTPALSVQASLSERWGSFRGHTVQPISILIGEFRLFLFGVIIEKCTHFSFVLEICLHAVVSVQFVPAPCIDFLLRFFSRVPMLVRRLPPLVCGISLRIFFCPTPFMPLNYLDNSYHEGPYFCLKLKG